MLSWLMTAPTDDIGWGQWSYAHRDQHKLILQAIQKKYGVNLNEYLIDPIDWQNPESFENWLNLNQQYHDDMNSILGLQGSNLQQLDPKDKNQFQAWIYLHRREHESAANKLGIS